MDRNEIAEGIRLAREQRAERFKGTAKRWVGVAFLVLGLLIVVGMVAQAAGK